MVGYFSLVGLLRVHCLLADYRLALQSVSSIDLGKKGLFTRVTACHISIFYYVGFAYLMVIAGRPTRGVLTHAPPRNTNRPCSQMRRYSDAMARELKVTGLMNVQYAIKDGTVYVLEVNPRASRTVPFTSKAIGTPLAKLAAKVMAGCQSVVPEEAYHRAAQYRPSGLSVEPAWALTVRETVSFGKNFRRIFDQVFGIVYRTW